MDKINLGIDTRLAQELDDAKSGIEELAVALCLDPIVFERHGVVLQRFDYLAQIIGEVAHVLRERHISPDALKAIRLEAMLGRLDDA